MTLTIARDLINAGTPFNTIFPAAVVPVYKRLGKPEDYVRLHSC